MTTIAYRDGILAADSRGTQEHGAIYRCEKLFRKGDAIIATAGDDAPGMVFVDWYGTKKKPPLKLLDGSADFTCLVLTREGLFWYDKWCRSNKVMNDFYAVGSGSDVALGAMHMGATAAQAVEVAIRVDCYSGGDVVTMSLDQ